MELVRDLALLMINARIVFFVDTKIVKPRMVIMMSIVVVKMNSRVQIIQIDTSLMMKKLGS